MATAGYFKHLWDSDKESRSVLLYENCPWCSVSPTHSATMKRWKPIEESYAVDITPETVIIFEYNCLVINALLAVRAVVCSASARSYHVITAKIS